jgi:hypothetical protein
MLIERDAMEALRARTMPGLFPVGAERGVRVFVIAGEPSGDALGAALMAGLRKLRPVPV